MQYKDLEIKENYPLKELTTMKVGGPAKFFAEVEKAEEVDQIIKWAKEKNLLILVLSGGSNMVVSDRGFDGLVIKIGIKGFELLEENKDEVLIKVGAGEVWDELVERVVAKGWWGIENLSYIPGNVGALVVQNAGAYGVEAKDVVESVEVYEIKTGEIMKLENEDCGFNYRKTIFNNQQRGGYIILNIIIKLRKQGKPNLSYVSLAKYFEERNIKELNLRQVRNAVIEIRKNKLPDWKKIGSVGSFFKNLVLTQKEFERLVENLRKNFGQETVKQLNKHMVQARDLNQAGEKSIKIPTAWLIDICGLKGVEVGGDRKSVV